MSPAAAGVHYTVLVGSVVLVSAVTGGERHVSAVFEQGGLLHSELLGRTRNYLEARPTCRTSRNQTEFGEMDLSVPKMADVVIE